MSLPYEGALRVSRGVLRALKVVNVAYGLAILTLFVASVVAADTVMLGLGVKPAPDGGTMLVEMRLIMVVGILSAPLFHLMLTRLLAIVETVRAGDPFIFDNARRLQTIAGTLLGVQLLHLVVGVLAARMESEVQQLDFDWSFSITPWLAVLLLFVLARVFEHGARMRADLEGTV